MKSISHLQNVSIVVGVKTIVSSLRLKDVFITIGYSLISSSFLIKYILVVNENLMIVFLMNHQHGKPEVSFLYSSLTAT